MIAKINTFCWISKHTRMHLKRRENEIILIEAFNFTVTFLWREKKSDEVWMKMWLRFYVVEAREKKVWYFAAEIDKFNYHLLIAAWNIYW